VVSLALSAFLNSPDTARSGFFEAGNMDLKSFKPWVKSVNTPAKLTSLNLP